MHLGYPELAKIASFLDHKTQMSFRHSNKKLRIAWFFGAIEAYETTLKSDEDKVYE